MPPGRVSSTVGTGFGGMPPSDGSHSQSKLKTISCEPLPRRKAETAVDTTAASFMSQTYPPLVPEGNDSCGKISPSETTPLPSPASYKWTPVSDRISLKISSSNLRSSQHLPAMKNTCGEYYNPSMSSRCTHIMKRAKGARRATNRFIQGNRHRYRT